MLKSSQADTCVVISANESGSVKRTVRREGDKKTSLSELS